SPVRSGHYRPVFKRFFWLLIIDILILGWCGGAPATPFYVAVSQAAAAYYFAHFLIILPLISRYEQPLPLPNSITESVLHGEQAEAAPVGARPAASATAA
ncbi:MAG: cytochrome b, partial [Sphingomicrobium sp.]